MDELRKNHILQLRTKDNLNLEGIVLDFTKDRILVLVCEDSIQSAKNIKELDELLVHVHTHCGIKKMKSCVINELNRQHTMIIENSSCIPVEQKREHVRVLSSIKFVVEKNDEEYDCTCINISAGGVAFYSNETNFNIGDKITIKYSKEDFGKNITISADIIKAYQFGYAAKYTDIHKHDADKIVKYVFNLIAKK